MGRFEDRVERLIREATEAGAFDDLPGSGKPLDLADSDDPNWWVKRKIRDEELDASALLPEPLQLRKEAQGFPESLRDIPTETMVRQILDDYNRRVRMSWSTSRLRAPVVSAVAQTVDVDDVLARWRALRKQ